MKKMLTQRNASLYNKELIKLGFSATPMLDAFSYNVMKILNPRDTNPIKFTFYIFGLQ